MRYVITRDGAEPIITEKPMDVLNVIPFDVRVSTLLKRIIDDRETIEMTFADGTHGTLGLAASNDPPVEAQAVLFLPRMAPRDFDVECRLLFEVPALVRCQARDKKHAGHLIEEVFKGRRPPSAAFSVEIDREHLLATLASLDKPHHEASDIEQLDPYDVVLNRIEER